MNDFPANILQANCMNRREFLKALGGAILTTGTLCGLAGCGGAKGPIKIGTLLPYSGGMGEIGQPLFQGAEFAVDQINESKGPLGRELKLINKDTQTDPQVARKCAEELVKEKVNVIVGAVSNQTTVAISEIAIKNRVVQITPACTSMKLSKIPDKDYLFSTVASNALQGKAQAQMALKIGRGLTRVSVIHVDNTYGKDVATTFKKSFEEGGGEVPAMVAYKKGKSSYRNVIGEALRGEPEFINLIAYPEDGAQVLKEALENQWARYFFFSDTMKSSRVIELVGSDLLEGLKGTAPLIEEGQSERIFVESFQNKFHTTPPDPQNSYIRNTYDAIALIALAIQKANKVGGQAIRDNLRRVSNPPGERIYVNQFDKAFASIKTDGEINYEGASGSVDLDSNGYVNPPFEVWKIEEGSLVTEEIIRFK